MNENGHESTGNPPVDAALARMRARTDAQFKELSDALLVETHLQARTARAVELHQDAIKGITAAVEVHHDAIERITATVSAMADKLDRAIEQGSATEGRLSQIVGIVGQLGTKMLEIEDKLNLLIGREMRREGLQ